MNEDFGGDIITISDEDGNEFDLELLDTIEFEGVGLYRQLVVWISATSCAPTLTIYINRRIYLVNSSSDELHRLNIVHSHQVETESVDMVFIHPVKHTLYHIVAHQSFL